MLLEIGALFGHRSTRDVPHSIDDDVTRFTFSMGPYHSQRSLKAHVVGLA